MQLKIRLLEEARKLADEIAANAPLAVQAIKRTVDMWSKRGLDDALRFEALNAAVGVRVGRPARGVRRGEGEARASVRGEVVDFAELSTALETVERARPSLERRRAPLGRARPHPSTRRSGPDAARLTL